MTNNITQESFTDEVLSAEKPVLVDFHADWCGPCHKLSPILDELIQDFDGTVTLVKVDVDVEQELAAQFDVMTIPTLILFVNGEPVYKSIGVKPKKALASEIAEHF